MGHMRRRTRSRCGTAGSARWTRLAAASVGAVLVAGVVSACGSSHGVVINLYGGASDAGFSTVLSRCNQQADGQYTIVANLLPSDADGQREQFVRRLAAHDPGLDILGMDVTWTAEFAEAGWIRQLTGAQKEQASAGVLEQPLATAEWQGKLYGIPRSTNVQLLWYRKSLTPHPPTTWADMLRQAQALKSAGKPYQIGLTAAQYEGYVVAFNTMMATYGGKVINANSTKATVTDGSGVTQALTLLHQFAISGLTSPSLSNDEEPQLFAEMETGQSAFSINWPYVLSAMRTDGQTNPKSKAVADDLGFAPYPQIVPGQPTRVTLGGMNYAISSYSQHPAQAFEAAMCLRDATSELDGARDAGNVPVLKSLYDNAEFQQLYPMYKVILQELQVASIRPKTPFYQNISTIISTTLSPPQSINPKAVAAGLQGSIQQTLEGQGILP